MISHVIGVSLRLVPPHSVTPISPWSCYTYLTPLSSFCYLLFIPKSLTNQRGTSISLGTRQLWDARQPVCYNTRFVRYGRTHLEISEYEKCIRSRTKKAITYERCGWAGVNDPASKSLVGGSRKNRRPTGASECVRVRAVGARAWDARCVRPAVRACQGARAAPLHQ